MACDLQGTLQGTHKFRINTKIFKFNPNEFIYNKGKFIVGFAGSTDEFMEIVDFYNFPEAYKRPPAQRNTGGLVLTEYGEIFYFSNPVKWLRVKDKIHAIGSGSLTALGALKVGASPKEAVLAASQVDPFTGLGTKVLKF